MSTETSRILAEHSLPGNFPEENRRPPMWLIDRLAEEKLMGGYSRKRNKLCRECFVLKSETGECNCT